MGGDVRLDSEGKPTRFTLDLPAEPIPPGAPRSTQVFSRENAASAAERVPQG